MIAYFDTSALLPLLVSEPASGTCGRLWNAAERILSVRLAYPEARAAIARAHRMGRITSSQLRAAIAQLDAMYGDIDRIDITEQLTHTAGELAQTYSLRGYDAVHLAGATRARDSDLVFVTGGQALADAASSCGLAVARTI